ncbi:unnamed protein product [Peronospora belbahrii]|uniref:RxLR effector protein n=1 Tax=Peronospora belbahrii TaxID=622444 RepID=A0AAU9LBB6_9STRA|nr:unnamed protein product [Peronospora belbahrii]
MAVEASVSRRSCATVLVIFALLVFLATIVETVNSMSKGAICCSDSPYAANDSVSVKRHLKTNAAMTANDLSEERSGISGLRELGTKLKSSLSTVIEKIQVRWWWLWGRKQEDMLISLKRRYSLKGEELVKSSAFSKWLAFVKYISKDPESVMFSTLARNYYGDDLFDVLASAAKAYDTKIKEWLVNHQNANAAFMELMLHDKTAELSKTPGFFRWLAFLAAKDRESLISEMFSTLKLHYSDDKLADVQEFAATYDTKKSLAGHQTAGAASEKPDTKILNAHAGHQPTDAASAKPHTKLMNAQAGHQSVEAASAKPQTKLMNAQAGHQSVDAASGKPDTKIINAQAGHQTAGAASRKPDTKISNAQASHQTTDAASAKPDTTIMNAKADHQTTNAASATPDTKLMNAHTDHQSVDVASGKPDTKLMNAQAGHQTAGAASRKPDTKISNAQASHQTTDAASAKPDTTIMNAKS